MAATFGSPVSAVLLAVELLLFEFRSRSLIPCGSLRRGDRDAVRPRRVRARVPMPALSTPGRALALYVALGAVVGLAAVAATRAVYAIEDAFEQLRSTGCGGPRSAESRWA